MHFSCLVDYASHKSMAAGYGPRFRNPWQRCPTCRQIYQGKLSSDLTIKLEAVVEKMFPDDKYKRVDVLNQKMIYLSHTSEKVDAATELLLVIEQIRALEYLLPRGLRQLEVNALNVLGSLSLHEETEEGAKAALEYFSQARERGEELGSAIAIAVVEDNIAKAEDFLGDNGDTEQLQLERGRKLYDQFIRDKGAAANVTVQVGLKFCKSLYEAKRAVEAERVLAKLFDTCKQVHGPDHHLTNKVNSHFAWQTERIVEIRDGEELFELLRCEIDGNACVVQGPISKPRNVEAEKTTTISSEDIWLRGGTPVVCLGLTETGTTQFNGKIGDVRSCDKTSGRYIVHFEDDSIGPQPLEKKFLRVLFDLPDV